MQLPNLEIKIASINTSALSLQYLTKNQGAKTVVKILVEKRGFD